MSPIPVHLAVEDDLSESVIRRVLLDTGREYAVGSVFGRGGFGYLQSRANNWNAAAAAGTPVLLLTDLDQHPCPPGLIENWLDLEPHANLIFRVAVREIESWLLADREGFAHFLGIDAVLVPPNPDELTDPKQMLVSLARRSRSRVLRESIVPRPGGTAVQGPDYNACLADFVRNLWNRDSALEGSPSLSRTWERLMVFEPTWP